jgi:hypothetical protein
LFQERLEASAKENTSVTLVASLDEDGAPLEAEVVVACPLCKSEFFVYTNSFMNCCKAVRLGYIRVGYVIFV